MLVTVNVTQECIDDGERHACTQCPIALALQPLVDGLLGVERTTFTIRKDTHSATGALPHEARLFVAAFDNQLEVAPFSFELDIPDQYLKPTITQGK